MANNHVQDEALSSHAAQNIYTDPEFNALFSRGAEPTFNPANWHVSDQHHLNIANSPPQRPPTSSLPQQPWHPAVQSHPALGTNDHFYNPRGYTNSPLQSAQYRVNPYAQPGAVDPSLVQNNAFRQQDYGMSIRTMSPAQSNTIAPQALQNASSSLSKTPTFQVSTTASHPSSNSRNGSVSVAPSPSVARKVEVPKGKVAGQFSVIDFSALSKATNSVRLHNFVTISDDALDLPMNRTTIPPYNPRKSINELRAFARGDQKLLSKLLKKPASTNPGSRKLSSISKIGSSVKREPGDSASDTESSYDSSDYSSEDEEEPEQSPLPAKRPEDPQEAVRYDVIKATWHSRTSHASSSKIREGLGSFWEVVKTIQNRWRMDSKAVLEAEESKKIGELPLLRSRVKSQRDMMETALKAALENGHPDIIHQLGQVKPFLYLLYQFLANRLKHQDYDGGLSTAAYELLSRCGSTMSLEALEDTKLSKALKLLQKKVNETNKGFIQKALESATAASKAKSNTPEPSKPAESKDVKPQPDKPQPAKKAPVAPVKKAAPASSATKAGTPTTSTLKRPGLAKPVAALTATAKPKATQVVSKNSSFFSSLQSANKKAVAAKANAAERATPATFKAQEKKPAPVAPIAPVSKPAFSFSETMASLLKPKEPEVTVKPEKQLPPETPEQKAKRLRKESRRHLRVTFRPDASLVSIQYFHHEPEEEIHHDSILARDAGDIDGEGRMFKQLRQISMDEDDDDLPREESYGDWREPSNVDFSALGERERKQNYERYGGVQKPICPEKEDNERREASTLLVFYTHPDDIPSSPREPLESQSQGTPNVSEFGPLPDMVQKRAALLDPPQYQAPASSSGNFSELEAIVKQLAGNSTPATQPQTSYQQQPQYSAAVAYTAPPAAPPVPDLSSILKSLQTASQPAAPAPVPAPAPAPVAQPTNNIDLGALLAAINGGQQPNTNVAPPPMSMPSMAAWPFAQFQQPQQQQNQVAPYENEERKRYRESSDYNNERDYGSIKRGKWSKDKPPRAGAPAFRVVPCKFFLEGKCTKGDACTYIHDITAKR